VCRPAKVELTKIRTSFLLRGGNSSKLQLPSNTDSACLASSAASCVVLAATDVVITLVALLLLLLLHCEVVQSPDDVSLATVSLATGVSIIAQLCGVTGDVTGITVLVSALVVYRSVCMESVDDVSIVTAAVAADVCIAAKVAVVASAAKSVVTTDVFDEDGMVTDLCAVTTSEVHDDTALVVVESLLDVDLVVVTVTPVIVVESGADDNENADVGFTRVSVSVVVMVESICTPSLNDVSLVTEDVVVAVFCVFDPAVDAKTVVNIDEVTTLELDDEKAVVVVVVVHVVDGAEGLAVVVVVAEEANNKDDGEDVLQLVIVTTAVSATHKSRPAILTLAPGVLTLCLLTCPSVGFATPGLLGTIPIPAMSSLLSAEFAMQLIYYYFLAEFHQQADMEWMGHG